MKKFSRIISVFMVLVIMSSLFTFNSSAASIKKIEVVTVPTKTTFVKGTDWDYGHWTYPEGEGFGEFTPDEKNISFMHQGGYFSRYQDRGMLDMNGLVVKVTYSDGKTKNIAYKETKHSNGVVEQNIYFSPQGGEFKLGENIIEVYFLEAYDVYATYKINIVEDEPSVSKGDVNSDKKINSTDALMVLQHSVKLITLTSAQITVADMNSDNKINSLDALVILQKSVGM
ncbi:MAG: dockerin type I repeat-containing protein [Clostridia bacterium]|nr:dockerin type I repeat-containing protein [Clostridia bacterium]